MPHTTLNSWQQLSALAANVEQISISSMLAESSRASTWSASAAGLYLDYAKHLATDEIMATLMTLAEDCDVQGHARAMYNGALINVSENRAATHMAARQPTADQPPAAITEHNRLKQVSDELRDGSWRGVTGAVISDVINIGIGGSDLGPKMAYAALREFNNGPRVHFISNVDGAEINTLIQTLDAATTVIVISSKTFTTAETLLNAKTALDWLGRELGLETPEGSQHCLAVTASAEAASRYGIAADRILTFSASVGGRYSVWSPMGLPICIGAGYDNFRAMLDGGAEMDRNFLDAPPQENLALVMGMLGVWYNNFLGAQSHAVVPYCQRLRLFVDHLQQLDMESNGKSTLQNGDDFPGDTGPIVWGQTGTNGQHAFFQLLHQGTKLIPVDFIGVVRDGLSSDDHHRVLLANMIAQSEALMTGQQSDEPFRVHPGNRPSTTILLDELTPYTLGALIALYENKVFTMATVWGINPFDQWGVELGKQLAQNILDNSADHDASTTNLMIRTGLSE